MKIRSFRNEKKKQYYFRIFDANDDQVLRSEAYESSAGRDNGIESFKKNAPIPERYERLTSSDGKFYFNVKAANHQVVATSLMFDSEEKRESVIAEIIAYATSAGKGDPTTPDVQNLSAAPNPNNGNSGGDGGKEQDDYHDLSFYENSGTDTASGFDRFQKGDDNYYYFSFKSDDGKVLLLSQGYTAEAGRDNGITSVEKNAPIEKRYSTHHEDGKFYFTLKAGNHQEIARSSDFDSEKNMNKAMAILMNGGGDMMEPEMVNAMVGGDGKELDDYMDCDFYQDSGTGATSGFDRFQKGDHGFHYFSFIADDGRVILKSQGYKAEAGRDNGIASVEKNGKIEKRYSDHTTDDGKFFFTLKAGNHQEIAQSCNFDSAASMRRAMTILMNGGGAMVEPEIVKAAPKSSRDGMDDYRTFGFYKDSGTDVQNGWDRFYSEKHNEYYFSYKVNGEPVLISEGYTTEAARENGIASVEKNWSIDKRYQHHETSGGRYYYTIRAGNHQEIARSNWYPSAEERDGGISWLLAGGLAGAIATNLAASMPPVKDVIEKTIEVAPEKTPEKEDDYLPCKEYEGHDVDDKVNNIAFFKHEDGQLYFVVYKADGSVRLRSEGFETAKDRDEELSGVLKNLDNEEMYDTVTRGKYSMHILKDKTGREVGRSCLETNSVAVPPIVAAVPEIVDEVRQELVEDDYLPCKEYEGHEINDKENNVAFFKHENGQFYFVVYKTDGDVRLRSEGFETAKNRDVELSGVLKNLENSDMYETVERGKYRMYILRDKTGREVGRSCLEKEEEKIAPPIVEAIATTAIATAVVTDIEPVVPAEPEPPKEKEDDYLACKEYEGHEVNDKVNNVAFFKHENGQFYFVIYKEDGSVRLRSEGFEDAKTRDVELSGVLKNMDNPEMYETLSRGKYRIHILSDADGREVGRSCLETVEEKVAAPPIAEAAAATAIAAAAVAATEPDPEPETVVPTEPDKEDDYLPCKEYENRKVSDKKNNVAFFKHSDGQYYFVIYKSDGTVRLRSEGFRTARERDSELSGALKNLENADMYETVTRGKYSLHILKNETGREVGRSCLETESNPLAVPIVAAAAAAAAAVIPVVVPPIKVEEEVITPVAPAPVVVKKTVAKVPPVVAAAAAEGGGGGFNWKWLLLLLPLLLAFLFWKGCDCGNNPTPTPTTPAKVNPIPVPPSSDTLETKVDPVPDPEPPVPASISCNCTGSSNVVFNIPSNQAPKVLTRLGRNPEFGNSHSLDPAGFYTKLKNAHASNDRDKKFLDDLFKAMGYSNGFAEANTGLFSNATIAKGTNGNMGQGAKHRTNYAKLNTSGKDLEAFKIKAANGCDIHFMKTCGNHFFFCPK